jgi:cation:H+ antiporter
MSLFLLSQWLLIFAVSLYALIKGAELFVDGMRQISIRFGMSAFVTGMFMVGVGTSLPELSSSLVAVWSGVPNFVIATAVGSNIINILLVVGAMVFFGGRVLIQKKLIKTILPIFVIATIQFALSVYDGVVDRTEALLLLATFGAYVWYSINRVNYATSRADISDSHQVARGATTELIPSTEIQYTSLWRSLFLSIIGLVALLIGATFTVDMAVNIASAFSVPVSFIAITMLALGTALPELVVAIQAIRQNQLELGVGNIVGSNLFTMLVVVGLPSLFVSQMADSFVIELGLTSMLAAAVILVIHCLLRRIERFEGLALLILFIFFVVKLVELL